MIDENDPSCTQVIFDKLFLCHDFVKGFTLFGAAWVIRLWIAHGYDEADGIFKLADFADFLIIKPTEYTRTESLRFGFSCQISCCNSDVN